MPDLIAHRIPSALATGHGLHRPSPERRPIAVMTPATSRILSLVVAILVGLPGCATRGITTSSQAPSTFAGQAKGWIRTELYMGAVPAEDWKRFLADSVTPRFPDGFTVLDAYGQWRAPGGEIRSLPSRVLVLLHPPDTASETGIEEVRSEFKKRFGHISVLRASAPAAVGF